MEPKAVLTFDQKLYLFDFENFKRKVQINPSKYDWRNNLISLVEKARMEGKDEIHLHSVEFYLADTWVLHFIGCYYEFEHLGGCCEWYYYIFLNKESHERYLKRKEENLIESLSIFQKMKII